MIVFFLMIRRPPRSTQSRSSAASDVYKRQDENVFDIRQGVAIALFVKNKKPKESRVFHADLYLSLIHISEPTRPY